MDNPILECPICGLEDGERCLRCSEDEMDCSYEDVMRFEIEMLTEMNLYKQTDKYKNCDV